MQLARVAIASALVSAWVSTAQSVPLPARPLNATSGRDFANRITSLPLAEREQAILDEILSGNIPDFLRRFCLVNITNVVGGKTHTATIFVTPDYLAVGADEDYFLTPLTPVTAQLLADRLDCTLPTRKMVEAIYTAAEVKLAPSPIPPSAAMTSVPVFLEHNDTVRTQRGARLSQYPPATLVAGHKKDVVITPKLVTATNKVAIYGWHQTNGTPIQPLYLGHTAAWVDYSHGIRLVQQRMIVNGQSTTVAQVLADPALAHLISDEGTITNLRYPANTLSLSPSDGESGRLRRTGKSQEHDKLEFKAGPFGEHIAEFTYDPEVRIQINTPAEFTPDKSVLLVLYALPNGNTIEQTVGRQPRPGDDWHFDIQHIGAQTRFLRTRLTNESLVIAYLEAGPKSWPAWRRQHGDLIIPEIIERIRSAVPTNKLTLVLTGHSGGGSFTFGYLNSVRLIPDDVARIAFLDSTYNYETTNHLAKLTHWLKSSPTHTLCVLAYHDSIALLDGKTFVSERGGTWGRSHAMLTDLGGQFPFTSHTNDGLRTHTALNGRLQLLLMENPDKQILHTVQVERNGFIHAMLSGTPIESNGYEYFGERVYTSWIQAE